MPRTNISTAGKAKVSEKIAACVITQCVVSSYVLLPPRRTAGVGDHLGARRRRLFGGELILYSGGMVWKRPY